LAAVLINDVKADASGGAVTVEIATSDPVAPSDVRVSSSGSRRLYVYLDGSTPQRMTFGEGPGTIVAYTRHRYTKLEIPTTDRCGEPFGVVRTESGVRVRATCRDRAAAAATGVPPVLGQPTLNANRPLPDAPQMALARDKQSKASLRAALALPPEAAADDGAADGPSGEGVARAAAALQPSAKSAQAQDSKASPSGQAEVPARTKATAAQAAPPKTDTPDAPAAAVVSQDSTSDPTKTSGAEQKSGSSALTTVFAVVLLLGVGIAATLFARRRVKRERMIRIVETASIGPRRSLVVACIGGRTMVLGVSEAGVALLDSQLPAPPFPAVADPEPNGSVEDAALGLRNRAFAAGFAAETKAPEPKHESSLLGRLFHRRPSDSEGLAPEDFEHLFSESLEDEDLRRKLAAGESGRVA
jgi:flagellar biogenesis protein FliO